MSETIEVDHDLWNKQKKAGKLSKLYFWTANLVALGSVMFLFEAHRVFDESQHRFNYFQSLKEVKEVVKEVQVFPDNFDKGQLEKCRFCLQQARTNAVDVNDNLKLYDKFLLFPRDLRNEAMRQLGDDSPRYAEIHVK